MKEGIQRQAVSQSESESELRVLRRTKLKLVHCKFALLLAFRVRDGACVCPFLLAFVGFAHSASAHNCSHLRPCQARFISVKKELHIQENGSSTLHLNPH